MPTLPQTAWKTLSRAKPQAENEWAKRPNYRERIVVANEAKSEDALGTAADRLTQKGTHCHANRITKIHRQPTLEGRRMRDQKRDGFAEHLIKLRLIKA